MEAVFALLREAGTSKARLDALETWKAQQGEARLSRDEASAACGLADSLLRDNNWKVTEATLVLLRGALQRAPKSFEPYAALLLPPLLDRLGDTKASVREAARALVLEGLSLKALAAAPTFDALAPAWSHKSAYVREEMARLAAGALCGAGTGGSPALRLALPRLVASLDDPSPAVRDAAVAALRAAQRPLGAELRRELEAAHVRPGQLREILGDGGDSASSAAAAAAAAPQLAPAGSAAPIVVKPTRAVGGTLRTAPSARDAAAQAADAPRALATALGDDGLVHPSPVRCASERELAAEAEALAATLAPAQEWDVRMAGLARLEGLVMGGAARMDGFHAALKSLRDALLAQLADRRSSVVKQACHLCVVLAAALGNEFEPHAEALLPAVFGVVIISVKVMSDAGVACVRGMLRHCAAPRLAARVADAARADRNPKLRASAFEWLATALEDWGREADAGLERHAAVIEDALRSGVADADVDARANCKRAATAYARRWPDAFARLCARADGAAGRRLRAAAAEGEGGGGAGVAAARAPRLSASSAVTHAVAAARAEARARAAAGDATSATLPEVAVTVLAPPSAAAARPGSSGGARPGTPAASAAALRPSVSDVAAYAVGPEAVVPQLAAPLRRGSVALPRGSGPPPAPPPALPRPPRPNAATPQPPATPPPQGGWDDDSAPAPTWDGDSDDAGPAPSVAAALALLPRQHGSGAGSTAAATAPPWAPRAAAYAALRRALDAGGAAGAADAAAHAERLCAALADGAEDGHQSVAHGALEAIAALAAAAPDVAESGLDRLLPGCFARLVDVREALRGAASSALACLGETLPPEALLPPLGRVLDRERQPRARTGVLEFALHALVGTTQEGLEGDATSSSAHTPATPSRVGPAAAPALRAWAAKVAPLAADKHAGLRNAAVANLVAMYERVDAAAVLAALGGAAPAEQAALRRALAPYLPGLDAALASRGLLAASALERLNSAGTSSSSNGGATPRLSRSSSNGMDASPAEAARPGSGGGDGSARAVRRSVSLPSPRHSLTAPPPRDDAAAAIARALAALSGAGGDAGGGTPTPPPSPRRKAKALGDVRRLASAAPRAVWADTFAQVLVALLEALADVDAGLRTGALLALRDVALHQPALCADYVSLVAPRALSAARDDTPGVAAAAEAALEAIFGKVEPMKCLDALRPLLPPAGAAPAAVAADCARTVRCVSAAVQRAPPPALAAALPALLPPLFAAFNAESADVRKAVVFCLVDVYLAVGETLSPHLAPLTSAQAKLLQIYIQRATQR